MMYLNMWALTEVKILCFFHTDPHIKVTGTKEAVTEAKEKILNILNTNVQQNFYFCYCL